MRLTTQQINDFHEKGFLVVPNLLSSEEVQYLRTRILEIFESGEWQKSEFNSPKVLAEVYNYFPEFIDISLKREVIEVLTDLCKSEPVLMPETGIHYKFYTGWHKDTSTMQKSGETFHLKDDCLLLQCGFYLQDNTEKYGGGLTVMEASHKTPDSFITTNIEHTILDKVKIKTGLYSEEKNKKINPHKHRIIDIPSKAGDFVIFNMKTNHRATNPANGIPETVPVEFSKLALFNAFTADNFSAEEYFRYISSRPEPFYQSLKKRAFNEKLNETASRLKFKLK
jgi:hypothetical protein